MKKEMVPILSLGLHLLFEPENQIYSHLTLHIVFYYAGLN